MSERGNPYSSKKCWRGHLIMTPFEHWTLTFVKRKSNVFMCHGHSGPNFVNKTPQALRREPALGFKQLEKTLANRT